MKRWLLILALCALARAQNSTGSGVCQGSPLVAAGTCIVQNTNGKLTASFETVPSGSPTSVSIAIQGCMRGGTCDTASATVTATTAIITYATFAKAYDSFLVTATTLSGGTSPKMAVNYRLGAN